MKNTLTIPTDRTALTAPLSEHARKYVQASKARNTQRAYQTAWREFVQFCDTQNEPSFPASSATIVEYLTTLAEQKQKVSTIQVKLAAITFAHRSSNAEHNPAQSENVRILMQGIRRELKCAPTKKSPITRDELTKMLVILNADLQSKRDKAILLIGFAGAFRRSELAGLNVEDIRFGANDMTITLRQSKTDQDGEGVTKRIPILIDANLCPVRALHDWLDSAQIKSGALFCAIDRWGHARSGRIDNKTVALIIKRVAKAAGLESRQFSGHSLRAGFATQAATDETPEWEIAEVTGHKSPAVLRGYMRTAGRGQMRAIKSAFGEKDNAPTHSINQ